MTEAPGTDPQEMRQRLIQKSLEDEGLRQQLLSEPKTTVEQELGTLLPEEVEVLCVEETQDTVYLVLPPKLQEDQSGELSDSELEAVAGGQEWTENVETQIYPSNPCSSC
ncbi:MAG: NHLP leader peptide family RiPP precursor [Rubrobacteraceae bacterium]